MKKEEYYYNRFFYKAVAYEFEWQGFKVVKDTDKYTQIDLETDEHILIPKNLDKFISVFYLDRNTEDINYVYQARTLSMFKRHAFEFMKAHKRRNLRRILKNDYEAGI